MRAQVKRNGNVERIALAIAALAAIASELLRALPGDPLMDFGSFVASARAAREGLSPYGVYPLTLHVVLPGFQSWNPNLNPPVSALLFRAFDLAEPHITFRIWWAVSVLLYGLTVLLLLRRYEELPKLTIALWAFALAGFWDTLVLGQIYVPLVLAAAGAWLLLERGERFWSGFLIGLVIAMKPNFLVWPALLFLSGHRRPALVACATAAAISAVPLLWLGPEVYRQWLELILSDRGRAAFLTNVSVTGLGERVGAPALGLAASVALLAGAAAWAFRHRPGALRASGLALVVSLLASPIAWIHYTLFLLPVFFSRWSSPFARLAGALLIIPVPLVLAHLGRPAWIQATVGSLYGWAVLLVLADFLRGRAEAAPDNKGLDPWSGLA
jgi:hypothetical protein